MKKKKKKIHKRQKYFLEKNLSSLITKLKKLKKKKKKIHKRQKYFLE